jgi:hypothetical protein
VIVILHHLAGERDGWGGENSEGRELLEKGAAGRGQTNSNDGAVVQDGNGKGRTQNAGAPFNFIVYL